MKRQQMKTACLLIAIAWLSLLMIANAAAQTRLRGAMVSSNPKVRDLISIFEDEEHGWDWTYHAFREADIWSVEHSSDRNNPYPSLTPTNRQLLLQRYFARNR